MRKLSIQFKIGLLMVMAVTLITAVGYLSYRNISSIVSSIQLDVKPELRLIIIREISMDLEKAQNSIRIYSITNDTADLRPYYNVIAGIDQKLEMLRFECQNDPLLLEQTDTISSLIEENIAIWNDLLYLNNNTNVTGYLKGLSEKLATSASETPVIEKSILKRVFSRNPKTQPALIEEELITDIQKIERQERITKEKLITREFQLAGTGSEIKEQFYDLIAKMENEVQDKMSQKANSAGVLAEKTYKWLAIFSLSGTLLAILVLFIVIRYVRKTSAYQTALQNAKEEAERLAKTKELFVANISHEIRTPITAISGFSEQLMQESTDENISRILKIIKSSSDHLAKIINDVLDFSKLQNSKLTLEKVHFRIKHVIEDVYNMFVEQALKNNNSLSYSISPETPPVIYGDPYRLKQIIINLVSNSIKFTKDGNVKFSVSGKQNESGEVELNMEFSDSGIGIDENKLDFIFEDFTQEEMSTTRKYGGTGLGLSIVRKLVDLHHGSIECKSRKNEGTIITCRLQFMAGDENQVEKEFELPAVIPEEIRKMKILIVDDVEYNRMLFKTILDKWKMRYDEAVNGIEALEKLKSKQYNLIFMDVRMPGIDGLKASQFIRNDLNFNSSELQIIGISAASTVNDLEKYRKAGMDAFLHKPFTEKTLLTTILSVINDREIHPITDQDLEESPNSSPRNKINLTNLYHISGGDEQFAKEMLITFIKTTEKGLKDFNKALIITDAELIANIAHKMLPPSRHVGANYLADILSKIEENAKNKEGVKIIESLVEELKLEYKIVKRLLEDEIAKIP
ncbi:MAG: response regulator [Bacteroidales bacterium]|nr:response regulator [Bacteroidales bacterium]